ncbi:MULTISPECIES: Gfo/Idh/MocA family oxidoreductase [Psychrobacter]|uniref:Oxidoreductase n=1 Tax=Psychrobacter alimentarius TaxID=261164 RepID=A0ABN4MY78_9GAMM|nr:MULTISPECIES: Gfo/Idh/MocA family oxidoreductase [Psychrobacter]AMT95775.1 oxidoreductase [Psychrobacter alimentarius]QCB31798.1 Gfo/Idh/MocA family oxidoreductase [Psychrobacter sp. PAMC27889]
MKKKFALIGAAGYIAPRHMKAIKELGGTLVAAYDKSDSVGVIDSISPDSEFFTEFERFSHYIYQLQREESTRVDYISICSPNYLHLSHITLALRMGCDVICEKPLVLSVDDLKEIQLVENETGKRLYNILQLRLHNAVISLKSKIDQELLENPEKRYDCEIQYITSRGKWYQESWKGDVNQSGGIATNIGVHFFDLLYHLFGEPTYNEKDFQGSHSSKGKLKFKNADVNWFLSVNSDDLPEEVKGEQPTFRAIKIGDDLVEFSKGFTDLHTISYKEVLEGRGFGAQEAACCIEMTESIRNQ